MLKMLLAIVFGVIYLPLNMALLKVSAVWQKAKHEKDLFDLVFLSIIMGPLWLLAAVFSYPYELLVESAH